MTGTVKFNDEVSDFTKFNLSSRESIFPLTHFILIQ